MNKRKIREDIWYHVEFEVSFFQRNQKAAEIFLKGKSIQEKLFDNPRIDKFNYGFIPRFKPDDDSSGMMYIRDQDNNEFKCKIHKQRVFIETVEKNDPV